VRKPGSNCQQCQLTSDVIHYLHLQSVRAWDDNIEKNLTQWSVHFWLI